MEFKKPRGTLDWYGSKLDQYNEIVNKLKLLAKNYGFSEIVTPTFESLELFKKSIGEVTDITQKELYCFQDKKDRWLALRPEGTSCVVRAYVEEKMYANKVNATKLFYVLNLFRYERPQNGRLREFHQFGVEYLNINSHLNDIECLLLAYEVIKVFNLENKIKLKVNYLGNFNQRQKWINELKKYFVQYKNQLTEDSVNRLDKNPLRILDDKIDGAKPFVKNAPKLNKFLIEEDNKIFSEILEGLKQNNIKYTIDDSLVRGLDYYTGLVFEFVYTNNDMSTTLIGGGRYSDLVKQTNGPDQIGLGFAMGIERLILALEDNSYKFETNDNPVIVLGASSYKNSLVALKKINLLREKNIHAIIDLGNFNKSKNAKFAIKNSANYFVFLDDNNINNNEINLENLQTNEITKIKLEELINKIG